MANQTYFDVLAFKETKDGKKRPVKLGYAKQRDDGGFWVYLDALPLDGNFAICPQRTEEGHKRSKRPVEDEDDQI